MTLSRSSHLRDSLEFTESAEKIESSVGSVGDTNNRFVPSIM
jgi:hypothetical protein